MFAVAQYFVLIRFSGLVSPSLLEIIKRLREALHLIRLCMVQRTKLAALKAQIPRTSSTTSDSLSQHGLRSARRLLRVPPRWAARTAAMHQRAHRAL